MAEIYKVYTWNLKLKRMIGVGCASAASDIERPVE
jgi:hypothetical protein